MAILGPVVDHHQNLRGADSVGEQLQQRLGLRVNPVQVLEDDDERLVEALAHDEALDRLARAAASNGSVHLVEARVARRNSEQREQMRQRIFERAVERQHLAGDLFAPRALVVTVGDTKISFEQVDHRQIRRRLAVRERKRLEHQAFALPAHLEFVEQARLADSRLGHGGDDLPAAAARLIERLVELLELGAAADELRQAARRRHLQARPQRADSHHLVHVDRIGDALDSGRAQRFQVEVAGREFLGLLGDDDRACRRQRLHPRRQAHRMANRRVLGVRVVGSNRAHDHLAGVESHANFDRRISRRAQARRIARHLLLHAQRRVQTALSMIFVRDGRAEQREDSVAGGLHDVTVVAMDGVDHQLERRIDDCARLFGIEAFHQIHRALDVGEQRGHGLALAARGVGGGLFESDADRLLDDGRRWLRAGRWLPERPSVQRRIRRRI